MRPQRRRPKFWAADRIGQVGGSSLVKGEGEPDCAAGRLALDDGLRRSDRSSGFQGKTTLRLVSRHQAATRWYWPAPPS
jgi:hypothetical protein